jgi:hypothetical protein
VAVAVAVAVAAEKGILHGRLQFPRIRVAQGVPRGVIRALQKIHVGVFIKKGHEIKCPETVNLDLLDLLDLRRYLHQYRLFR